MIPASTHWERLSDTAAAKIRIRTRGLCDLPPEQAQRTETLRVLDAVRAHDGQPLGRARRREPFGARAERPVTSPTSRLQNGAVVSGALTHCHFRGRQDSAERATTTALCPVRDSSHPRRDYEPVLSHWC